MKGVVNEFTHFPFLLIKIPFKEVSKLPLTNRFNIKVTLHDGFQINTTHLKASSSFHEERKNQLKQIISFQESPNYVIFGDLNIHNSFDEKNIKELSLVDCWDASNLDNQYTFNAQLNKTVQTIYFGCENRKMRLDRFLLSENCIYKPCAPLQLFGNLPYKEKETNYLRHPSDHFGIVTKITRHHSNL